MHPIQITLHAVLNGKCKLQFIVTNNHTCNSKIAGFPGIRLLARSAQA